MFLGKGSSNTAVLPSKIFICESALPLVRSDTPAFSFRSSFFFFVTCYLTYFQVGRNTAMDDVCIPLPTSDSHVEVLIPSVMRWKDRVPHGDRSELESWYFPLGCEAAQQVFS